MKDTIFFFIINIYFHPLIKLSGKRTNMIMISKSTFILIKNNRFLLSIEEP